MFLSFLSFMDARMAQARITQYTFQFRLDNLLKIRR